VAEIEEGGRAELVMLALVGIMATAAARKAVDVVWVAVTGTRSPRADDPDVAPKQAISAALVTGAVMGVVQMGISRKRHEIKRRKASSD